MKVVFHLRWLGAGIVILFAMVTPASTQEATTQSGNFEWQTLGEEVYLGNCSACHQANGEGVLAAFPPLAEHLPTVYAAEGGRDYLIRVVLFGLQGETSVKDQIYNGVMPSWSQLSDEQVAAVLNHELTSWDNQALLPEDFTAILPEDVANARQETLSPQQVYELRGELELAGSTVPQAPVQASTRTRWFTQAQSDSGKELYADRCAECHGKQLEGGLMGGPPLKGSVFEVHWGGGTALPLFAYTSTKMPQDRPGSLSDQQYVELLAYILANNGFQPGPEALTSEPELLQQIKLEP